MVAMGFTGRCAAGINDGMAGMLGQPMHEGQDTLYPCLDSSVHRRVIVLVVRRGFLFPPDPSPVWRTASIAGNHAQRTISSCKAHFPNRGHFSDRCDGCNLFARA